MQWSCHLESWLPNWIWIFSRCHPASNSKNKDGQQVQGEKKYSPFVILILWLIFHWKVFLTFVTCFISWPPTESGDTIWILTTQLATEISVFEMRPWFLPIFSIFFKSSFIFFYQKSSPPSHWQHVSHFYMLASSLFLAPLLFGAFSILRQEIEETREEWWIMLLGFCF